MTSPSMQPQKGQPAKAGDKGKRKPHLLGDPNQSFDVSLSWSTGGVTATFPAGEIPSSATWNGSAMSRVGSTSQFTGSGRNATNALVAQETNGSFSNNAITNGAASATLRN